MSKVYIDCSISGIDFICDRQKIPAGNELSLLLRASFSADWAQYLKFVVFRAKTDEGEATGEAIIDGDELDVGSIFDGASFVEFGFIARDPLGKVIKSTNVKSIYMTDGAYIVNPGVRADELSIAGRFDSVDIRSREALNIAGEAKTSAEGAIIISGEAKAISQSAEGKADNAIIVSGEAKAISQSAESKADSAVVVSEAAVKMAEDAKYVASAATRLSEEAKDQAYEAASVANSALNIASIADKEAADAFLEAGRAVSIAGESKGVADGAVNVANDASATAKRVENRADNGEFNGISVTHAWDGTVLRVTSASGTSEANLKGEKGDRGEMGYKGDMGPQGPRGFQGEQGIKGDTGSQGPRGYTGEKGEKGDRGEKGEKGDRGERGYQGLQGVQGEQGIRGERGEKGDKGDKGDIGPQGPKGDTLSYDELTDEDKADLLGNVSNAFKGNASGELIVLDDVSPIVHNMDVKVSDGVSKLYVCNKNLVPFPYIRGSGTIDGIEFTVLGDGGIKVKGTNTSSTSVTFFLDANSINYNSKRVLKKGTYFVSGTKNDVEVRASYFSSPDSERGSVAAPAKFTVGDGARVAVFISIRTGKTVDEVVYPMLEIGETETEYVKGIASKDYVIENGVVKGVTSAYPTTVIFADKDGSVVDVEYNKDLNKVFGDIDEALDMILAIQEQYLPQEAVIEDAPEAEGGDEV